MTVIHTASELKSLHKGIAVPTMGALHEGHLSLIRNAAQSSRPVVVSVFVNPTQFAPHEDFETYPRDLARDTELAMASGASAVYAPSAQEIYPNGQTAANAEALALKLPAVANTPELEDASRPRFFGGVCLVVARLFDLMRPSEAFFGEKDWQQLKTIEAMVAETPRFSEITITPSPTIREEDGLAMSSRNTYLKPEDRYSALGLKAATDAIVNEHDPTRAESRMREILLDRGLEVDYAVVRDAETLLQPSPGRPARALIAALLQQPEGRIRLIDNTPAHVEA